MKLWLLDGSELQMPTPPNGMTEGSAAVRLAARGELEKARNQEPESITTREGRVAWLALRGPLTRRYSYFSLLSGGGSMEGFAAAFQRAVDDPEVGAIAVSIDSPGGTYDGTPELARRIFDQRGAKGKGRIVAVADGMAASAAYWLGSSFERLYVTPSGDVGSIGTIWAHAEFSRALDEMGITVNLIRNPAEKADVNAYEPLSEGAREYMQSTVDAVTGEFVAAVAKNRGVPAATVRSEAFGGGRLVRAAAAKKAGMVDGVGTFADVAGQLAEAAGRRRTATAHVRQRMRRRR